MIPIEFLQGRGPTADIILSKQPHRGSSEFYPDPGRKALMDKLQSHVNQKKRERENKAKYNCDALETFRKAGNQEDIWGRSVNVAVLRITRWQSQIGRLVHDSC